MSRLPHAIGRLQSSRLPPLPWAIALLVALGMLAFNGRIWLNSMSEWGNMHGYIAQTDFILWFGAAHVLATGHSDQLYDLDVEKAARLAVVAPSPVPIPDSIYHYWPILGGSLMPVAGWPIEPAFALWVLVGVLAFTGAVVLLIHRLRYSCAHGLVFGLAAWGFFPHTVDIAGGQPSGILCLPLAAGLLALRAGAEWPAGLILGLLCFKPQLLLVWVVGVLVTRRWRALAGIAVTALALIGVSTLLAGPEWIPNWIAVSRYVLGQTSGHGFDPEFSSNFKQIFATLPGVTPAGANTIQAGVAVALAGIVALLWWRAPRDLATPTGGQLFVVTTFAMLLATPVLLPHDLTFWIVAGAFMLAPAAVPAGGIRRRTFLTLAWIGWCVPLLGSLASVTLGPFKPAGIYMLIVGTWLAIDLWRIHYRDPNTRTAQIHSIVQRPLS